MAVHSLQSSPSAVRRGLPVVAVLAMILLGASGIAAQTTIVDLGDLAPGPRAAGGSSPGGFTQAAEGVVFAADTDATGREVFMTYGAAGDARLLADLRTGEDSSRPEELTAHEGWVYFRATGDADTELFRTDGTSVEPVTGDGTPLQDPSHFFSHDGWLWFAADTGGIAVLWRTDGTTTELVTDAVSNVRYFAVFQDQLYFHAFDLDVDTQLWRLDGTAAVPVAAGLGDVGGALADRRDQLGVWDEPLVVSGDQLWFEADSGAGQELHAWDGQEISTVTLQPDDSDSIEWITAAAGWTWFTANDGTSRTLYRSDGQRVQRIDALEGQDPQPQELLGVGDTLVFHADGPGGREVFQADVDGDVVQLTDLVPGDAGASAEWLTPTIDGIFFAAQNQVDDVNGLWLIKPDGVEHIEGPRILAGLTVTDLGLLFSGSDDVIGDEPRLVRLGTGPDPTPTPTPDATPTPDPTSTPTPTPDPPDAITRLAGPDRISTAVAVSQATFPDPVATVYLATGDDFPDALAGGPAAAVAGAPLLLTTGDGLPDVVRAELVRLSPDRVVLLGGQTAIGPAVEDDVDILGVELLRLAGAGRVQTAVAVSQAAFEPGVAVVYLATANSFPDALAAGARAGALAGPVLLVGSGGLDDALADELRRLQPGRVVVAGGVNAVTDEVADAAGVAANAPVARAAGASRYETAVELAADITAAPTVIVATGAAFPDALAGVVPAAIAGAPMLLVDPTGVPAVVEQELVRLGTESVIILGGEAAVSAEVAAQLTAIIDPGR